MDRSVSTVCCITECIPNFIHPMFMNIHFSLDQAKCFGIFSP